MRNLILLLISSSLSANPTSWGDQNSGDDISIIFYFWVFMITAVIPYVGYMIFKDAETFFEKFISIALTISFSTFWINLLGYLPSQQMQHGLLLVCLDNKLKENFCCGVLWFLSYLYL